MAEAFSPRSNSLALLRLGLALLVAVSHAFANGFGEQPALGRTDLADFAVDGFFVLSGFLVTRSRMRLGGGRFAWHRFLRIMPGFWVCLVVTALVMAPLAALASGRAPLSVFTSDGEQAWRYVVVNSGLPILQYEIADLAGPRGELTFNGSLWTLQYEAVCYVLVGLLGVTAVLRAHRAAVAGLTALVWVGVVVQHAGLVPFDVPVLTNDSLLRFLLVFLLGALGHLYAEALPVRWQLAAASLVVLLVCSTLPDHRVIGAVPFAYLFLYAAVRLPWRPALSWDLSYGVYVYHWPVQVLLVLVGAASLGGWALALLSIAVTLPLAALSWRLVERPALGLKHLAVPRPGRRPTAPTG